VPGVQGANRAECNHRRILRSLAAAIGQCRARYSQQRASSSCRETSLPRVRNATSTSRHAHHFFAAISFITTGRRGHGAPGRGDRPPSSASAERHRGWLSRRARRKSGTLGIATAHHRVTDGGAAASVAYPDGPYTCRAPPAARAWPRHSPLAPAAVLGPVPDPVPTEGNRRRNSSGNTSGPAPFRKHIRGVRRQSTTCAATSHKHSIGVMS
jgi:hypothetical protein